MVFRFYSNTISQASRAVAAGIFIVGMLLIGFGYMIYLLPKFFATLAAIVFCVMGIGCAATAVKIFIGINRAEKNLDDSSQGYRENVQIHIEDHRDLES